jgi:hypothetical protein
LIRITRHFAERGKRDCHAWMREYVRVLAAFARATAS